MAVSCCLRISPCAWQQREKSKHGHVLSYRCHPSADATSLPWDQLNNAPKSQVVCLIRLRGSAQAHTSEGATRGSAEGIGAQSRILRGMQQEGEQWDGGRVCRCASATAPSFLGGHAVNG